MVIQFTNVYTKSKREIIFAIYHFYDKTTECSKLSMSQKIKSSIFNIELYRFFRLNRWPGGAYGIISAARPPSFINRWIIMKQIWPFNLYLNYLAHIIRLYYKKTNYDWPSTSNWSFLRRCSVEHEVLCYISTRLHVSSSHPNVNLWRIACETRRRNLTMLDSTPPHNGVYYTPSIVTLLWPEA